MISRAAGVLALALPACSNAYVAIESGAPDSDLRVIATFPAMGSTSNLSASVTALPATKAFKILNLKDAFAHHGDELEVYVFPYSLSTIQQMFPLMANMDAEAVAAALKPELGTDIAGFEPPSANTVLHATIGSDSAKDVIYQVEDWNAWLNELTNANHEPFEFNPDPSLACTSKLATNFRFFAADQPSLSCHGTRTAGCHLELDMGCDVASICSTATGQSVRELPSGELGIGEARCAPEQLPSKTLGLTKLWRCDTMVCGKAAVELGVQDDQTTSVGGQQMQWVPAAQPPIQLAPASSIGFGGVFTRGGAAAFYAYPRPPNNLTYFDRFSFTGSTPADTQLTEFGFSMLLVDAGLPRRLSASTTGDLLVIDGQKSVFTIAKNPNPTMPTDSDYVNPVPRDVGLAFQQVQESRVGEVIVNGAGNLLYAALSGGIGTMTIEQGPAMPTVAVTTPPDPWPQGAQVRLSRIADGAAERVVACVYSGDDADPELCSGSELRVYDSTSRLLYKRDIAGTTLAVIDGPRVIYRPIGQDFVIAVCSLSDASCDGETRYLLPVSQPMTMAVKALVGRDAFLSIAGKSLLAFSAGTEAGMLDLDTGFSETYSNGGPLTSNPRLVPVLFPNAANNSAFAVCADQDDITSFVQLAMPPLVH
jgi:hypothetical protein